MLSPKKGLKKGLINYISLKYHCGTLQSISIYIKAATNITSILFARSHSHIKGGTDRKYKGYYIRGSPPENRKKHKYWLTHRDITNERPGVSGVKKPKKP
jgi:hypothetical protein